MNLSYFKQSLERMETMKRNGYNIFLVLVIVAFICILQACSTGNSSSKEDGKTSDASGKSGGTLKVVMQSDVTSVDPHFTTDVASANILYQKVYEQLVTFDEDMDIVPSLAKEWDQLDDVTWEFVLNEDVSFHDGTPFNAEAVKATFDRLLDPETGSPQRDKISMIEEVEVVDDYTVHLHLSEPYAPILSILSSQEASIMNPKTITEDPDALAKNPIGTGPFTFVSWQSGQAITLEKYEDYWGTPAKVDKVIFEVVPEDTTRIAMIETGEAHISLSVPVSEFERVNHSDNMNLLQKEGLSSEFIGFNFQNKPFDNVEFRQAISHAINRESIISGIYNNSGTLANASMSPNVFGYSDKVEPYEYDINTAKELLEKSGVDVNTEIKLVTNDRKERIDIAEVVESQLKGIGLNVKIHVLELGSFSDAIANGEHDMFISGWGNATGDGDYNQYNLFHSESFGSPGNYFFYSNPEVDKIIETARGESDDDKRIKLYEEAQILEMEDAVYIPLRNGEHTALFGDGVKNFTISPVNYLMINEATIE